MSKPQSSLTRLSFFLLGVFTLWAGENSFGQDQVRRLFLDGSAATIDKGQGSDSTSSNSELVAGQRVIRLTDVTVPTVTWYPAGEPGRSSPAIVVLPGGGYQVLASDLEGTEVCAWLNKLGISALLLRYRVPTASPHLEPLLDAQDALKLLVTRASEWHVDREHIGLLGFSAGAHLAARLAGAKQHPRLAGVMLIYPAYLQGENKLPVCVGSPLSVPVTPSTPPLFLVQAEDDPIGVGNALGEYLSATQNKVPTEMHLYATGGHGYGVRQTESPATRWTVPAASWLARNGFASGDAVVKP